MHVMLPRADRKYSCSTISCDVGAEYFTIYAAILASPVVVIQLLVPSPTFEFQPSELLLHTYKGNQGYYVYQSVYWAQNTWPKELHPFSYLFLVPIVGFWESAFNPSVSIFYLISIGHIKQAMVFLLLFMLKHSFISKL